MPPPALTIERLLGAGYFPEVLPPCFGSDSFGAAFSPGKTPPTDFTTSTKTNKIPKESFCVRYNHARVAGMRRQFSIPNPIHFYRLASCFLKNWADIEKQAKNSPLSLTKPVISAGRRCFRPEVDFGERPSHRARVRATARYILQTDIARFFPSIYTHSIPWAFHGKSTAKANHSFALFGNEIDMHFRSLQDKQTIGIPIGQDISRVIAEVILSRVEEQINIKRWPVGLRCIDDYEVGFINSTEANEFLHKLQHALSEFELGLNPLKTKVCELPFLLIEKWDAELRSFDLGGDEANATAEDDDVEHLDKTKTRGPRPRKEQLILFFNKALELQLQNKDEAVLRFSLKRLAHLSMNAECWPLYQDYLFQCALNRPETLRLVISNLLKAVFLDRMNLDKKRLKTVLNEIIKSAAPIGYSGDVAWALWASLLFKIRIGPAAARELEIFQDSVVGCLCCQAMKEKLLPKKFDPQWIRDILKTPNDLYGDQWLIAYEAHRNNWLGATSAGLDSCFGYLIQQNTKFFIDDHAAAVRKEIKAFVKARRQRVDTADEDEDEEYDSEKEDALDAWWFRDSD